MEIDILDKFSTNLKEVLSKSLEEVIINGQDEVEPINLLYALTGQRGSIAFEVLRKIKFKPKITGKNISSENAGPTATKTKNNTPVLSPDSKRAIEKAVLAANIFSHKYIGTEHLLFGLLEINDKEIVGEIKRQKIDLLNLKNIIENILKTTSKFPDLVERSEMLHNAELGDAESALIEEDSNLLSPQKAFRQKSTALEFFSVDLTSPEIQGNIDPLIGRESEVERLMQILCRRHKNNPLLLGDPGVGKTAIVEGLAKKIMLGQVPNELADKRILSLDLSLIIAGTMYRGEFEARLKQIIEEIKINKNLIVFIDEVHNLVGAGSTAGSLDAANILKPALARGELHCIGATTLEEYKKHIESDPALERRFQTILIKEPTRDQAVEILKGIKPNYEKFHRVKIDDRAIEAAVDLSVRYHTDKFLPDKAIDIIDEAASGLKLEGPIDQRFGIIREMENQLNDVIKQKQQAVLEEHYPEAVKLKEREKEIARKIYGIKKEVGRYRAVAARDLRREQIFEVVAKQLGISSTELRHGQNKDVVNLALVLKEKIIGQDHIIDQVAKVISRAKIGFRDSTRPLASFLLVGPSGVGKTELAKTLAKTVYPNQDALIQIDMAEFRESYTASKLLGSPAGYIGYKDRNKFTDEVRKKPFAVILFDEFEKAHPDIQSLLLQILDQGEISDGTGRKINFKNTIIFLTTNLGQEIFGGKIGFAEGDRRFDTDGQSLERELESKIKEHFKTELLNRLDKILYFQPIGLSPLKKIARQELKKITEFARGLGYRIEFEDKIINDLVRKYYQPEYGVRSIKKIMFDLVENPLSEMILNGKINKRNAVQISQKNGKISFLIK